MSVEVTMRPVCECGYVFEELHYNRYSKTFAPNVCPNCNRVIGTFKYDDLSKRTSDSDGDILICGATRLPCSFCQPGPCNSRL